MKKTIWKFALPIEDEFLLTLPEAHDIVHVGLDPNGNPCMWCEVLPGSVKQYYRFHVVGTGHPVPFEATHVGSFVQGPFVWHLYRVLP